MKSNKEPSIFGVTGRTNYPGEGGKNFIPKETYIGEENADTQEAIIESSEDELIMGLVKEKFAFLLDFFANLDDETQARILEELNQAQSFLKNSNLTLEQRANFSETLIREIEHSLKQPDELHTDDEIEENSNISGTERGRKVGARPPKQRSVLTKRFKPR